MAKQNENSQKKSASKEKLQIELTMKNADMIKSSIKMAYTLCGMAGVGSEGIMTSLILAVGDFIIAMASSTGVPVENLQKEILDQIRDYVKEHSNNNSEAQDMLGS